MNELGLSVIIPVYNVSEYIVECIQSIIKEDPEGSFLELIIINDCSTDDSIQKIQSYIQHHDFIRLIQHKENKGLGESRNTGMRLATKSHITFIDSDDHIQSGTYKLNYKKISDDESIDFLVYPLSRYSEIGKNYPANPGAKHQHIDQVITRESLASNPDIFYNISTCHKIYRKDFLLSLTPFPTGKYEDIFLSFEAFLTMSKCLFSSSGSYFYRMRDTPLANKSIMQEEVSESAIHDHISLNVQVYKFILHNHPDLLSAFDYFNKRTSFGFLKKIIFSKISIDKSLEKDFKESLKISSSYSNENLPPQIKKIITFYLQDKILQARLYNRLKTSLHSLKSGKNVIKKKINKLKRRLQQIPYLICAFIHKKELRDAWVFTERSGEAQDNAFYMFSYITQNYPQINAYYIIQKSKLSSALQEEYGDKIILRESSRHKASHLIASTHLFTHVGKYAMNFDMKSIKSFCKKWIQIDKKYIFLQHGIIINDVSPGLNYNKRAIDYFITSTKQETDFIQRRFGYTRSNIIQCGLPRYDSYYKKPLKLSDKKEVLVFLTWRARLSEEEREEYHSSILNLYKELNKVIETNLSIKICPHFENKDMPLTKENFPHLTFIDSTELRAQLVKSSLLITDYSSIQFDFAVKKQPIIYYQPALSKPFSATHYKKGYFNYEIDNLGEIASTAKQVSDLLIDRSRNDFRVEPVYLDKIKNFFGEIPQNCTEELISKIT